MNDFLFDFSYLGNQYLTGKSFGASYMDTEYYFFPTWKPNVWISFCSIYNWESKMLKVNVNNQLAFQINNLQTETKYSNSNVILLNAYSYASNAYIYPFDGSVTDVNIWSRAFSDEESENWSKCNFDRKELCWIGTKHSLRCMEMLI